MVLQVFWAGVQVQLEKLFLEQPSRQPLLNMEQLQPLLALGPTSRGTDKEQGSCSVICQTFRQV